MGVEGFIEIILESQVLGLASNVGVRGFSGFLHDIAHLACQDQVALALDGDGFGVEDFAACDRPCEAIDAAYGIRMFFSEREEFHWSQVLVECLDGKRRQLVVLEDDLLAYLAAEGADGSFKVTDACFSGVSCDDFLQERRSEADVSVLQAVSLFLSRHEVFLRDFQLLFFRVASEFDQFHTIEQGSRDGGDAVGRREEENLREIEGNVDVVIVESFVLFRIECFKQCRSRITAEIRADLVDFVQQHQRVVDADFADGFNEAAWHSTDVGAAVAADFSFIMDAA